MERKNSCQEVSGPTMLQTFSNLTTSRFAFNGSFNIHLFIGDIDEDQSNRFITKKNEVGFTTVFATASSAPCANCVTQRENDLIYEDAIPITPALFSYLASNPAAEDDGPAMNLRILQSFEPGQVVDFLKKNLAWRVTDMASNSINTTELAASGLEVSVSVREFDLPSAEKPLGIYYPAVVYEEITRGKIGGVAGATAS